MGGLCAGLGWGCGQAGGIGRGLGGCGRHLLHHRGHSHPGTFSFLTVNFFRSQCDAEDVLVVTVFILAEKDE